MSTRTCDASDFSIKIDPGTSDAAVPEVIGGGLPDEALHLF
jgi:hypothetical protein